jgi:hypothetical protein
MKMLYPRAHIRSLSPEEVQASRAAARQET